MSFANTLRDTLLGYARWLSQETSRSRNHDVVGERPHLTLLARGLPPNTLGGAYRPTSFLQYAPLSHWHVSAFAGELPTEVDAAGETLLRRIPAAVPVTYIPDSLLRPSWSLFPQLDGSFADALAMAQASCRALQDNPPAVVVASGPPFSVFVAGYFVARYFGARLVLDYRDEWTECPFDFVSQGSFDLYWEKRCLKAADAVLFTTRSHIEHQLETFVELDAKRCHLLPNGWDPIDFDLSGFRAVTAVRSNQKQVLSFIGNLSAHTMPHEFLGTLQQLLENQPHWRDRLTVRFIGHKSAGAEQALKEFAVPDVIECVDHLNKQQAADMMKGSDVLLLIAVAELQRYLPGKLFDYVASNRPVLVFGHSGEASNIVEQTGAGVFCASGDSVGLGESLHMLSNYHGGKDRTLDWLQAHRRDRLTQDLFEICRGLLRV